MYMFLKGNEIDHNLAGPSFSKQNLKIIAQLNKIGIDGNFSLAHFFVFVFFSVFWSTVVVFVGVYFGVTVNFDLFVFLLKIFIC